MRPPGEIRQALQQATQRLVGEGRGFVGQGDRVGVTWPMAVQQAQVGRKLGRETMLNMARDGVIERIGRVAVPGVCRPMTLYAPAQPLEQTSARSAPPLDAVLRTWFATPSVGQG